MEIDVRTMLERIIKQWMPPEDFDWFDSGYELLKSFCYGIEASVSISHGVSGFVYNYI